MPAGDDGRATELIDDGAGALESVESELVVGGDSADVVVDGTVVASGVVDDDVADSVDGADSVAVGDCVVAVGDGVGDGVVAEAVAVGEEGVVIEELGCGWTAGAVPRIATISALNSSS